MNQCPKRFLCGLVAAASLVPAALGQSAGGSLEDPFDDLEPVTTFFGLPFGGPVDVLDSQIELLAPTLLLPLPIEAWQVFTFQDDNGFDALPDDGAAFGTGTEFRDPIDRQIDGSKDLLAASILENGVLARLRAQLRELPLPSEVGLQFNLNLDANGETAERFATLFPFQPSAQGWISVVGAGTQPFPWQPTPYYDLVAAALDASTAGEVVAAVAVAAEVPRPPPEALAQPHSTPVYTFFLDTDGDPTSGGLGGFDVSFSAFFNQAAELDTVVRRFNGAFFEVDPGVPSAAESEENLVFVGLDASNLALAEEFRWKVIVNLAVVPPGSTEPDDAWFAEVDESTIVYAQPLIDPETSDETELADGEEELEHAVVAVNDDGRVAVVWQGPDGEGVGVFAVIFGADGVEEGPPFPVPGQRPGNQTLPDVVWIDNLVVFVWLETHTPADGAGLRTISADGFPDPEDRIMGRIFEGPGEPLTDDFVISDQQDGNPQDPNITADGDGDVVVTWEDDGEVRGRQYDPTGDPKGPSVGLGGGQGNEEDPVVAASPTGDFVAVWVERPLAARATAGDELSSVRLRVFGPDGEPKGPPRVVASGGADDPDLAVSDTGEVVVVYEAPGDDDRDIYRRRYDPSGRPRGDELRVNQSRIGDQRAPRVDSNAAGDFIVVWENPGGPGDPPTVDARVFEPGGTPASPDLMVAETENGSRPVDPDVVIENDDEATIVFTRRRPDLTSEGLFRANLDATFASGLCTETASAQCLQKSRFRVQVLWRDDRGNGGEGRAIRLTSDTGYFWFFNQTNVEMVIKVLDGCALNDRIWVFAGGLTNVETAIIVDDTLSGVTRTYYNPPGIPFQPIQDTAAFATCTVAPTARAAHNEVEAVATDAWNHLRNLIGGASAANDPPPSGGGCSADPTVLCLNGDRFAVEVDWETQGGETGRGQPVPLTGDTGYLWFFNASNVEVVIKVLDGCSLNGNYWVFAGGLTSVKTTIRVTDLKSGAVVTYENPQNTAFQPVQDTAAFTTCP